MTTLQAETIPAFAPGDAVAWDWHDSTNGSEQHDSGVVIAARWDKYSERVRYWLECERPACGCHTGGGYHVEHAPYAADGLTLAGTVPAYSLF